MTTRRLGARQNTLARYLGFGLLVGAASFGALVLAFSLVPLDSLAYEKDFSQEYLLARAILDRVDPYQPIRDLAARYVQVSGYFDKLHPTPHPPTVGLLALPLALLSYPLAAQVWFGFELACLVAAVVLLCAAARVPLRMRTAPLLALALVAWPPVTLELGLGQLMLPLLVGLAAAQAALLGGRPTLGGGLLGVTLLIKPIAWPWLIALAWRRDWKPIGAAGVAVMIGVVSSVVAIGPAAAANYATHVLPSMTAAFLTESTNMSLWTVAPRLGSVALSWVLPAVVLGLTVLLTWGRAGLGPGLAMMTIASLLVSPITWYFYLVLALLPATHVVAAVWRRGLRASEVGATLAVFALLSLSQAQLIELAHAGAGRDVLLEPALALGLLGILVARLTFSRTT